MRRTAQVGHLFSTPLANIASGVVASHDGLFDSVEHSDFPQLSPASRPRIVRMCLRF